MITTRSLALLSGLVAFGAATNTPATVAPVLGPTLAVDGRANANPSIVTRGRFVAIAWSAATVSAMDIFAAMSSDGGKTFSSPVRVNDVPGDARVNSELPPRIALVKAKSGERPDVVIVWTTKGTAGTRLVTARSIDGGRSFSAAKDVPGSEAAGSRGWQSVAVDENGKIGVLWLDHREGASTAGHMNHDTAAKTSAAKQDPTERAALSKLYFTTLDRSAPKSVTSSVCYCCKTSLVAVGNAFYGVWRHVYAGSQRDIAFTVSRDEGKTFSPPIKVSDDGWHIDGCPENGPAIAVERAGRTHVAWPTPPDGKNGTPLSIFYATSADGKKFGARRELPTRGPAAHAQVVVAPDGSPVIAWDEIVDGARHLAYARVGKGRDGAPVFSRLAIGTAGEEGWPVMAAMSSEVVTAWVKGSASASRIQIARF